MKQVVCYELEGVVYKTKEEAQRHEDAKLVKALSARLQHWLKAAEDGKYTPEYALLTFLHENKDALKVFMS